MGMQGQRIQYGSRPQYVDGLAAGKADIQGTFCDQVRWCRQLRTIAAVGHGLGQGCGGIDIHERRGLAVRGPDCVQLGYVIRESVHFQVVAVIYLALLA